MTEYNKRDIFTHEDYLKTAADLSKNNEYICETAGYVPLEVKFKQFEQNGIMSQFNSSEFTSSDYRNMYLNPDFDITPEDEIEDIEEKIIARNSFIEQYKKTKSTGQDEKAGTDEHKEEKQKEEKTE